MKAEVGRSWACGVGSQMLNLGTHISWVQVWKWWFIYHLSPAHQEIREHFLWWTGQGVKEGGMSWELCSASGAAPNCRTREPQAARGIYGARLTRDHGFKNPVLCKTRLRESTQINPFHFALWFPCFWQQSWHRERQSLQLDRSLCCPPSWGVHFLGCASPSWSLGSSESECGATAGAGRGHSPVLLSQGLLQDTQPLFCVGGQQKGKVLLSFSLRISLMLGI